MDSPSWEDFCARLQKEVPQLRPDKDDQQWNNLYYIYQMGYESCLDKMKLLLVDEEIAKVK